jgi:hypothetical protein
MWRNELAEDLVGPDPVEASDACPTLSQDESSVLGSELLPSLQLAHALIPLHHPWTAIPFFGRARYRCQS